MTKLRSVEPYPINVKVNGVPTNLLRNITPEGRHQIARVAGLSADDPAERGCRLLFEGSVPECEAFLRRQIEKDFPELL